MNTLTYDHLQVIEAIHGATFSEEFDRVQAKLSDAAIPAEIIRLYEVEILFAERLISAWKKQFPKGQRPVQYTAKKELVKVLKDEVAYWQGGADWINATNDVPAAEADLSATVQPHTAAKSTPIKPATSLRGLALEDVQKLFQHPILQSEGDRAAALAILNTQNYLTGSPYKVKDWFDLNVGAKVSRKLISDSIKEIREEGGLSEKVQQAAEWVAQWLEAKAKR